MNININLENNINKTPTKETVMLEQWLKDHPYEDIPMEMRYDCEKEKHELEALFTEFEKVHSLENLNSIINLTPELNMLFAIDRDMSTDQIEFEIENLSPDDARIYKIRAPAKKDLKPITILLNTLKNKTNITKPEHDRLFAAYKILSRAVGMINGYKIDHTH